MAVRKKRSTCPSCGAAFQRGRMVWRVTLAGVTRQRVCQTCAAAAVPVLAADAPARCQSKGCTNLAHFCRGCIGRAIEQSTGVDLLPALGNLKAKRR